jgi:sec-independent protein translocase protein TatA
MGPIGFPEMVAIFVIALLLFGPKKLPELGRTIGKAITEFRRASNELKATFESHLSELEKEGQSLQKSLNTYTEMPTPYSYSNNDYNHYDTEYHQYSGSSETSDSQPAIASATVVPDAVAHQDANATQESHLPGTVPRTAGALPSDPVPVDEIHPA